MKMEDKLTEIHGIGPKLAEKLAHHIDVGKPIRPQLMQPAVFQGLPLVTQMDLKYHPTRSIKRATIEKLDCQFKTRLGMKYKVCGSYRRGKPISRDIDIVCEGNWDKFRVRCGLRDIKLYQNGPYKTAFLFRVGSDYLKMDIFWVDGGNYQMLCLFATGSGDFNVFMRRMAIRRGYKLNQNGLWKADKLVSKKVGEIFDILNIKYVPPRYRSSKYSGRWKYKK
jgi:DNA polymerase/3'-5' exonuclease PolX